jgi:predicted ATP-grasp superfamily ATP-dependent carboligase
VLILGASTRAAAFSALRCGLRPLCADYFADRDLSEVCTVERVDPRRAAIQFAALAQSLAPCPWFYTGGFENHPRWVERIALRHRLWGVDGKLLRAVRDQIRVAKVLERHNIPHPAIRRLPQGLPCDGSWLKKPRASAGGRGIEALLHQNIFGSRLYYYQQQIHGPSYSALYVGSDSRARLIGITRQLIGIDGSPFAYRGNIGPLPIDEPMAARLMKLGDALASEFHVNGLFGVDFILHDGIPWPVEINPRYTASVEIHELALGRPLVEEHQQACAKSGTAFELPPRHKIARQPVVAKLILYAPKPLVFPEILPDENVRADLFTVRSIADVPWPGTCFKKRDPVMTLMASGADLAECISQMVQLEATWGRRLGIKHDDRAVSERSSFSWPEGLADVLDD